MSQISYIPRIPTTLEEALRLTANRIAGGSDYRWTHMGSCNCGHLAQTVTFRSSEYLHKIALQKAGDWSEQIRDYCSISGYPLDFVISSLLKLGATLKELHDLERLSNPKILKKIPVEKRRSLNYRSRDDVVLYMETWANLLSEEKLKVRC